MDYIVLKNEIIDDPKTLGYSGESDQWVTDKLNEIGASGETIIRSSIATGDVLKALVYLEVVALTSKDIQILNLFTFGDNIDPSDSNIQAMFQGLFGAGTTTRANLIALAQRSVSRAEKLGFPIIKLYNVANARYNTP